MINKNNLDIQVGQTVMIKSQYGYVEDIYEKSKTILVSHWNGLKHSIFHIDDVIKIRGKE